VQRLGAEILLAPGVYDALTGLIAEQAGAQAVYLSGASIAYTRFGRPDIGLVSMSEVADTIAALRDRIALPMMVDADNGFGNALNMQRTMRVFERDGRQCAAARGSDPAQALRPSGRQDRWSAARWPARSARPAMPRQSETLIIGRTDAIAVEGFDAAIDRAEGMSRPAPTCCSSRRRRADGEMEQIVALRRAECR
jgi:2-methylisocitrate lyase-like PEP mutase family enzyme